MILLILSFQFYETIQTEAYIKVAGVQQVWIYEDILLQMLGSCEWPCISQVQRNFLGIRYLPKESQMKNGLQ
jgi:hypothetical protein